MKKALILVVGVAVALLLFNAIRFTVSLIKSFDEIAPTEDTGNLDAPPDTGSYNILLIGRDKSDVLTDTMMMVNVDLDQKKISLVSLMRDTRVKIGKNYGKLNAVMGREKVNGLLACVKELTGSPVHYYVMVDLEGFVHIIDYLGGVEFDVPRDMKYKDPVQNLNINLKKGLQTLDGDKAMQLVRFRRYAEGDVQRTRVQQDFIKALIEQKLKPEYFLKLPDIFREVSKFVETNATLSDVIKKSPALKLFSSGDAVEIYEMPGNGAYVGPVSYYLHDEAKTYALFVEHFAGTGKPSVRKYTDYGNATKPNDGGAAPSTPKEDPPVTPPEELPLVPELPPVLDAPDLPSPEVPQVPTEAPTEIPTEAPGVLVTE